MSRKWVVLYLASSAFIIPLCSNVSHAGTLGSASILDFSVASVPSLPLDAGSLVELLRREQHVPINFIRATSERAVRLSAGPDALGRVLDEFCARDAAYRYQVVGGRLILYPADSKYEEYISIPQALCGKTPRLVAAREYTKWLRVAVRGFEDLLYPGVKGDPRAHAYTDSVALQPSAQIIEHFVQLLGDDETLMFSIEPAASGKPIIALYSLATRSRGSPGPDRQTELATSACPTCAVYNVVYFNETTGTCQDLGYSPSICGAVIEYQIVLVSSDCSCEGAQLIETVATDNGCQPGSVFTGPGCPIGASNTLTDCRETYSMCFPPEAYPEGTCTEVWTQEVYVCRLAQTVQITFQITKSGSSCSGVVFRQILQNENPPRYVSFLGNESFYVGQEKPVPCTFENREPSAVNMNWTVTGGEGYYTYPTSGALTIGGCSVFSEPLPVRCDAAAPATLTLSPTTPFPTTSGFMTCTIVTTAGGSENRPQNEIALWPLTPNPSLGRVVVSFSMPREAPVTLTIHNVNQSRVATLLDGWRGPGRWTMEWDALRSRPRLASGVYFVRLQVANQAPQTRKFLLLR